MSILVAQDGLYFCILSQGNKITQFHKRVFKGPESPEYLLNEIESALVHTFQDEVLAEVKEMQLLFSHPYFALVPRPYFLENRLSDYLKFNTKLLPTDEMAFDKLQNENANLVYVPYTNINNFLIEKFGEFHYQHAISVFLEQSKNYVDAQQNQVFLNIYPSHFDMLIFKKGTLWLCNSYFYFAPEDLVYYVLFALEQLDLNPHKVLLEICGEITEEDTLHNLISTYIKNVSFFAPDSAIVIDCDTLKDVPPHQYQFILNSFPK